MTTKITVGPNQTVTNNTGGNIFAISGAGDVVTGGVGDTFVVNDIYDIYNTYTDISGGTVEAGVAGAFIGLAGNYTASTSGISTITGNGLAGAVVAGNGTTLNLSGVSLSDVTIQAANFGQTITTTQTGQNFAVTASGDTLDGAGHDVFTVGTSYNFYNTYSDVAGGTIQAGVNNAFLGLTSNSSGISTISGNGFAGATLAGNGATLNLSGVSLSDVTIQAANFGQTITTTQTGQNFAVTASGDTLDGAGHDVFTVGTSYNFYNTYSDVAGGTIQAGVNNAFLGLTSNSSGISTISGNGFSGATLAGNGTTLNLSGISLSDVTIQAANFGQTITTTQTGQNFAVTASGDTINGAGSDTFTVGTAYNYYNSFNDTAGGTIQAGVNNAFLGLSSFAGISTISGNGHTGATLAGNGTTLNLSGISLSDVTIQAANFGQTITTTQTGQNFAVTASGDTINGAGSDTFTVGTAYNYYNSFNDTAGGTIQAGVNNAFLGLSSFAGISTISGNGHTGATLAGNGATLNLSGISLSDVTIQAANFGQTITTTQTGQNFAVTASGDTINGAGSDTFTVGTAYNYYNSFNDTAGGTIQAGVNNAFLGLSSFAGISTISGNGHTGATLAGNGTTLNLSGISLSDVTIQAANFGQTITTTQTGQNFAVTASGDTINGAGSDTFTVGTAYNYYNSFNDTAGGTIQAGVNNAFLGLSSFAGISTISGNGHTGATLAGNGTTLNLSGISLSDVTIQAANFGQTITTTQTGQNFAVTASGDTINGAGSDTFTVGTAYNYYNSFNDTAGGTIQAGVNNAFLGLSSFAGISTISGNGHTGATLAGNGTTLNLSGISLSDVTIQAANFGQTITTTQTGQNFAVTASGDTINGAGSDTFTVGTAYNYYNSFNDTAGGTIQAGVNNAFLGLSSFAGISTISGNGHTGATLAGNGATLNLSGISLSDVTIQAANFGQTITTTQTGQNFAVTASGDTINGAGSDTFTVGTSYNYYTSYSDVAGGTIQAGVNNAFIGISGSFNASNGISTISGNGYSGVTISDDTTRAFLDLSQVAVTDATVDANANYMTVIAAGGNQALVSNGYYQTFGFTNATGNDTISGFRAGNGSGHGVIELNAGLAPNTFSALLNDITNVNGNAVISLANGGTITIEGVAKASLTAADFNLSNVATGLSAANGTDTVGHGTTVNLTATIDNLITQGSLGTQSTVTTITALSATSGTASLVNGVASYTAPASGTATVSYTATDQYGDSVSGSVAVTVDGGPTLAAPTLIVEPTTTPNVTALLTSTITAGLKGDSETITAVTGNATLNSNGTVTYTAPATGPSDSFTYTVTDEYGDTATATAHVTIQHDATVVNLSGSNNTILTPSVPEPGSMTSGATITGPASGSTDVTGTPAGETINAQGSFNVINGDGGADTINAGVSNATVTVNDGDGNNVVNGGTGNGNITLGDGNNSVTTGGYDNVVTLGNGNNTVAAGSADEKVTAGNGNNNITATGGGNVITVGTGDNTVNAGAGGNEIVNVAGGTANVTAGGYFDAINVTSGNVTLSGLGGYATVTLGANFGASANDEIVLTGAGGDSLTNTNGVLTVRSANFSVLATIDAPTGMALLTNTDSVGDLVVTVGTPPPVNLSVITETAGNQTVKLAAPVTTLHLVGTGNNVSATTGGYTIDGDQGSSVFNLSGSGNDTLTLSGYSDNITLGGGNNSVSGTEGNTTITAGDGNNSVNAGGYSNAITLGNGNNIVSNLQGYSTVVVGNGNNTITGNGTKNTITVGTGTNTINVAGSGYTSVAIAGGTDSVTAGGDFDSFAIAGGDVTLSGMAAYATVTLGANFGTSPSDSLDLAGAASDSYTNVNGVLTVLNADGSTYVTVDAPKGDVFSTSTDSHGDLVVTAGAPAPVTPPVTPPPTTTLNETSGSQTVVLTGSSYTTVDLTGYLNNVSSTTGGYTIEGDQGYSTINLGGGNNTLILGGVEESVTLSGGGNNVSGFTGNSTITVGDGSSQQINGSGYLNVITLGNGNGDSVNVTQGGFSTVTLGTTTGAGGSDANVTLSGYDNHATLNNETGATVSSGAGNAVVTLANSDATVTLGGYFNTLIGGDGAAATTVSGGVYNTYQLNGLSSTGGLNVTDFNAALGDTLDLSQVTNNLAAGWSLTSTSVSSALDITLTTAGGASYHVATLQGVGSTATLASLEASRNIIA